MSMGNVIVFGGYGIFGGQVARALVQRGETVTIAGRDRQQAEAFARLLGPGHRSLAADVTRPSDCRIALEGHQVAVNCAGPFQRFDATLLTACLQAHCHYVDITDDRRYAAQLRSQDQAVRAAGLSAVYGCSSLPGISGALALLLMHEAVDTPQRARVTLLIGNRNPKGLAAVRSLVEGLGKPFAAPQGTLHGFRDREVVPLPEPFGRRAVFNFESPEYDLFPNLLGVRHVLVKAGFELRLATYGFALLARLGSHYGARTAALLNLPGRVFGRLGCSGAAIMTELFFADGSTCRAALVARGEGQRMAALPAALVAQRLGENLSLNRGVCAAYEFLGSGDLLQALVGQGHELHVARQAAKP
jgi:hypothetical protein